MPFPSFGRRWYLHSPRARLRRLDARLYTSSSKTESSEDTKAPLGKLRWYSFGTITASALGLWVWNTSSLQAARRPLSPESFTPAALTSAEKTSENTKLLHLKIPLGTVKKIPGTAFRSIWSIYVKDSDIQVERAYTPLEGLSPDGEMTFWIKKYEHGEVGRWLHRRVPGDTIEIRGPERTWEWQVDAWDNVIMVAGGTGITPFYQLLHSVFSDPSKQNKTKFTLLQSYRSPEELPPSIIIENLSSWEVSNPQTFLIRTFVDALDSEPRKDSLIHGRINQDTLKSALRSATGRTIVLICGPDPMINALAGPKGRDDSQGVLGGALGSLNDGTFHVWKL